MPSWYVRVYSYNLWNGISKPKSIIYAQKLAKILSRLPKNYSYLFFMLFKLLLCSSSYYYAFKLPIMFALCSNMNNYAINSLSYEWSIRVCTMCTLVAMHIYLFHMYILNVLLESIEPFINVQCIYCIALNYSPNVYFLPAIFPPGH